MSNEANGAIIWRWCEAASRGDAADPGLLQPLGLLSAAEQAGR